MGVAEDFSNFKGCYDISSQTISSISYRYRRITRQLNTDFWSSESETQHSIYVGPYGRDTAATGMSDLDIAFMLPYSVYQQYQSHLYNGQSALLQAVKRSIQATYPVSDSFGDGQVVVVNFSDGITFEVLPVFEQADGSFKYPNANDGGSWRTCDPRAEMRVVQIRSDVTNRNLKYLCRMMRVWRDYCSVPISGMLIDTLAYQFMETYEHRAKSFLYHDLMARDFFDFLSGQPADKTWWRAPGSGSYVFSKGPFQYKARSAYLRAVEAIKYNDTNYEWSRRQKWKEVFGPLFPS